MAIYAFEGNCRLNQNWYVSNNHAISFTSSKTFIIRSRCTGSLLVWGTGQHSFIFTALVAHIITYYGTVPNRRGTRYRANLGEMLIIARDTYIRAGFLIIPPGDSQTIMGSALSPRSSIERTKYRCLPCHQHDRFDSRCFTSYESRSL